MKAKVYTDYRRARYTEYPRVEDQLDAIWKILDKILTKAKKDSLEEDVINIMEQIKEVKETYPKKEIK